MVGSGTAIVLASIALVSVGATAMGQSGIGMANQAMELPAGPSPLDRLADFGRCVAAADPVGARVYVLARDDQTEQSALARLRKSSWACQKKAVVSDDLVREGGVRKASIADALHLPMARAEPVGGSRTVPPNHGFRERL